MAEVYVALTDLKYSVIAVAKTEKDARTLAADKARHWLTRRGIAEYFGISVTRIEVGTAGLEGFDNVKWDGFK